MEFFYCVFYFINCLGICFFVDMYFCVDLVEVVDVFVVKNFFEVVRSEEFLIFVLEKVVEMILWEELNVWIEEEVFEVVFVWIRRDEDEWKDFLLELLKNVRFVLISL